MFDGILLVLVLVFFFFSGGFGIGVKRFSCKLIGVLGDGRVGCDRSRELLGLLGRYFIRVICRVFYGGFFNLGWWDVICRLEGFGNVMVK